MFKSARTLILPFALFSNCMLSQAFAQTSSAFNSSTTTISTRLNKILESMVIDYKSLSGISAGREDESEFEGKIDYDEATASRMLNEIAIGYKVSKNTVASMVGVWSVQPGENGGQEVEPLDPYIKLAFAEVIEKGNFELNSDLRVGTPVSRESREAERVVTFGSEQELEYQFGKSDFSTELEVYLQYNVQNGEGYDDVEVRFEPAILYQFSDRTYGRVSYESEMHHERHANLSLIDNREPTIQTGIGWNITKKLELFPFIDVNVNEPGTKTSLYGAQVAWNVL